MSSDTFFGNMIKSVTNVLTHPYNQRWALERVLILDDGTIENNKYNEIWKVPITKFLVLQLQLAPF